MSRLEESYLVDLEFKGDLAAAPNGDLQTITGLDNLKQALYNRLVTVKGTLAHRPTYGIGIQSYQGSVGSIDKQRRIALEIKKQFKEDPRVEEVESIAIKMEKDGLFIIQYKVKGVGIGSFEDTFDPFGDFSL